MRAQFLVGMTIVLSIACSSVQNHVPAPLVPPRVTTWVFENQTEEGPGGWVASSASPGSETSAVEVRDKLMIEIANDSAEEIKLRKLEIRELTRGPRTSRRWIKKDVLAIPPFSSRTVSLIITKRTTSRIGELAGSKANVFPSTSDVPWMVAYARAGFQLDVTAWFDSPHGSFRQTYKSNVELRKAEPE